MSKYLVYFQILHNPDKSRLLFFSVLSMIVSPFLMICWFNTVLWESKTPKIGLIIKKFMVFLVLHLREISPAYNDNKSKLSVLGQVWYLIVSIRTLCTLTYFA